MSDGEKIGPGPEPWLPSALARCEELIALIKKGETEGVFEEFAKGWNEVMKLQCDDLRLKMKMYRAAGKDSIKQLRQLKANPVVSGDLEKLECLLRLERDWMEAEADRLRIEADAVKLRAKLQEIDVLLGICD